MSHAESATRVSLGKRKGASGITRSELSTALNALELMKSRLKGLSTTIGPDLDDHQLQGDPSTFDSEFEETLDKLLEMTESRIEWPQAPSFPTVNFEHLSALKIESHGFLQLKSDYATRAAATDGLGTTEYWSSNGLYRHLNVLQDLIPKVNEAAARTWINAFFFRVAAITAPDKKLVLSNIQATAMVTLSHANTSGVIHYIAIKSNKEDAKAFMKRPSLNNLKKHSHMLFVLEVKAKGLTLQDHVPLAVCELYAYAKTLGKSVVRGTLTNGQVWIFIFLKMNADGNHGMYVMSREIPVLSVSLMGMMVEKTLCTTIAGIIAHWIDHSDEDIENDDWFTL